MITYQAEAAMDVFDEVLPLLIHHREEVGVHANHVQMMPAKETYAALAAADAISVTTARVNGVLVGYAAYIISPHLHYAGVISADVDVFFLHKEWRRGLVGYRLLKEAEENVRRAGATHITQKCKIHLDLTSLFVRMGYTPIEKVFLKEL